MASLQPLHNPDIPHGAVAERLERGLIGGRVMAGDRGRDARPFRHHHALLLPGLEGLVGGGAAQVARAERRQRGAGELGVSRDLGGVLDLAIAGCLLYTSPSPRD